MTTGTPIENRNREQRKMTKFKLKDAELQKKLDEITDGDFSAQLKAGQLKRDLSANTFSVWAGKFDGWGHGRLQINLLPSELEEIKDFNPQEWNAFPEVTPPEGVLMRIERKRFGKVLRDCAIFDHGEWFLTVDDEATAESITFDDVVRFRQWE